MDLLASCGNDFNYRNVLKVELNERRRKNPKYSLRAFARDIDVSPAHLSEVLSDKVHLSISKAKIVAKKVPLPTEDIEIFLDMVRLAQATSFADATNVRKRIVQCLNQKSEVFKISVDQFAFVSDWRHHALMTVLALPAVNGSTIDAAARLGFDVGTTKKLVQRLLRIGFVRPIMSGDERYEVVHNRTLAQADIPSTAFRECHRALLQRAAECVETIDMKDRDISTTFLRIDRNDLSDLSRELSQFISELASRYESSRNLDAAYQLTLALVPVTQVH